MNENIAKYHLPMTGCSRTKYAVLPRDFAPHARRS
jgi:hypothetical protein